MDNSNTLTAAQAALFARLAVAGIGREYPNMPQYTVSGPEEFPLPTPRGLHPAFYGCFDWHSAVHSHWMLVRLLHTMPGLPEEHEIRAALATNLTAENLLAERLYLEQPGRASFERMYGWAWLLKLAQELGEWDDPQGTMWAHHMRPLADAFVARYIDFLPRQTYPIRGGTHANTAFGLTFALDYARATGHGELERVIVGHSRDYFEDDRDYPARWEPGGSDFLSPALTEADLMRRVLPPAHFGSWLSAFLPGLAQGLPANLFAPATVSDRTDPQLVHLDGLNLSRAWCMRGVGMALPPDDPVRQRLLKSAMAHTDAALPHIASGDYMGEHWLASFAVYLLTSADANPG
ncbi:MAG: DUF2891 domain-containing protein [Chloroflexota bacterium]|nr:DUF2891 domain-containing protein [Chloroflexota bacterium]